MKYDEDIVIAGLRRGDEKAYKVMVTRYKPSLMIMAYTFVNTYHDALDIVTQTLEDAFLRVDKYKPNYKFSTWLFAMLKYRCIDFIRIKKDFTGEKDFAEVCEEIISGSYTPEELFIQNQQMEMVHRVVDRLRRKPRRFVIDYYFNELKYKEIAEKHSVSEVTVRTHIHRAKGRMRELLTKQEVK